MSSLSDNQLTLDRITELLPINSKDKFLASIVVKEKIKKLKEKFKFVGMISSKLSIKYIEEIFGADLCSEEKGFIK